jgi:phosphate:Na+ symporter
LAPGKQEVELPKLVFLGDSFNILPATALVQADAELRRFREVVENMFEITKEYLLEAKEKPEKLDEIHNHEKNTDDIQKEVTLFVCRVMEKQLTVSQSAHAQSLVRLADELESVADYLDRIANYRGQFGEELALDGEAGTDFYALYDEVWSFFRETTRGIDSDNLPDEGTIFNKSEELSLQANSIRDSHIQRVGQGKYSALSSMTYSDLVVALRKVRSHSLNIAQALHRAKALRV